MAAEVTAEKGEKEIANDAESMYAFSAFAAANAANQWLFRIEFIEIWNAYKRNI